MKASELHALSEKELLAKAAELRGELFDARVKKATGQLEKPAVLRRLRRDIARVETILWEKRGDRRADGAAGRKTARKTGDSR